jgi:hypothetical protein
MAAAYAQSLAKGEVNDEPALTPFGRVGRRRRCREHHRRGEIYNLSSPADLTGNCSAVTAGLTAVVGGSVAYLRNENGVVIKLHSQIEGLRFNLSANGVRLTLKQS